MLGFLCKGLQHLRILVSGGWGWGGGAGTNSPQIPRDDCIVLCICIAQSILRCGNLGTEKSLDLLGPHWAVSAPVS